MEKLLESREARFNRAYELTIKAFSDSSDYRQVEKINTRPLLYELDRGVNITNRERTFFTFKGRYFLGVQKIKGVGLGDNTPFGCVKAIIQIPHRRHYDGSITLDGVNPDLWAKCLENREKVIKAIVKKYNLKTLWNDDSYFDYLLEQRIGGYNYLKGKKFIDLDEKEMVKKLENFINALDEWTYNDPTA